MQEGGPGRRQESNPALSSRRREAGALMCGFAGIYAPDGVSAEAGRSRVLEMARRLRHRGPDDEGAWTEPDAGVALAFRRLSIIDLTPAGHQPMSTPSGRWTLVFNGEVYNFAELRAELEARGRRFRGRSDTEVVLAAIETWGVADAARRFIGMFAIAVWDAGERQLFLVRDRMGIKPLYYHVSSGLVTFASELKALRAGPSFDSTVDREGLACYLRYFYIPAPRTIYRSTFKVRPGHVVRLSADTLARPASEPYWSLCEVAERGTGARREDGDDEEAVDALEELLRDAVARRLVSDVPLGALLSGGVDSTTVVALMQALGGRTKTFTIGFDVAEHDESAHARRIASHLGTDHTELTLSGEDALAVVPDLPEIFDEPLSDPSQIPTYLVSRLARRDVTVALTGDGGDELFAGYNRYVHGRTWISRLRRVPRPARRLAAAAIGGVGSTRWDRVGEMVHALPGSGAPVRLAGEKVHKLGRLMARDGDAEMYRSLLSVWDRPERFLQSPVGDDDPLFFESMAAGDGERSFTERMMLVDQRHYLPDDILAKVDRASMAVSLEVRVPVLDHRVVEHAWTLPQRHRIRDGTGKWILRQVLYRHVPRSLVERPKVGFMAPVDAWLRGPLRPWAEDLVSDLSDDDLLRGDAVRSAWSAFLKGHAELGMGLWTILLFQAWRQHAGSCS